MSIEIDRIRNKTNNCIFYGFTLNSTEYEKINQIVNIYDDNFYNKDHDDDFFNIILPDDFIDKKLIVQSVDFAHSTYSRINSNYVEQGISDNQLILIGIDINFLEYQYSGVVEIPNIEYIYSHFEEEVSILRELINKLNVEFNINKTAKLLSYCG